MRNLDPFELSRKLEKTIRRHDAFVRGLRLQPASVEPFAGQEFPGKTHFDFSSDLPEADPLRTPLRRWIFYLTDARIHCGWRSHEADLEYRQTHGVKEPEEGRFSLAAMRERAIAGDRGEPQTWWKVRARFETTLSAHRAQLAARQEEVGARLGIDSPSSFWEPLDGPTGAAELAREFLQQTRSDAESLWGEGLAPLMEAALARTATEGWPARLTPDSLRDLLGEQELYRGLHLQPGRLPERLCPMSFPRAAAKLGRALRLALLPSDLPLIASLDPLDLRGRELGALFALWTTSDAFLRLQLGLNQAQVHNCQRALKPAMLAHARLCAARAVARSSARRGPRHLAEQFPALVHLLAHQEVPPTAALVRFSAPDESETEWVALASAAVWERDLREEHDEDWYRNPRAQAQIREEMRQSPPLQLSEERCRAGIKLLAARASGG